MFFLVVATASPAVAQRAASGVALGAQFGSPSGLGLRIDPNGRSTYDFVAAWDLDDLFYLNGHVLFDQPVGQDRRTSIFYGPGLFVGFRDRPNRDNDETVFGLSASAGFSFLVDPFEIMLRVTPRVALIPETETRVGGGLGIYYWF